MDGWDWDWVGSLGLVEYRAPYGANKYIEVICLKERSGKIEASP